MTLEHSSLELKLQELNGIIGKPHDTLDPFVGVGGPVRWLSPLGEPSEVCRLLHEESPGGEVSLPSKEVLDRVRAFWLHLSVSQLDSGLVAAEIHQEEHAQVVYSEQIIECRGMKGTEPDFGFPTRLVSIPKAYGFSISVKPEKLSAGPEEFPATSTCGEKRFELGLTDEVTLSYVIASAAARTAQDLEFFPPVLKQLGVTLNLFKVRFGLTFTLDPASAAYECALTSGPASFCFDTTGGLYKATIGAGAGKNQVVSSRWSEIFSLYFPAEIKLPKHIDPSASVTKIIKLAAASSFPDGAAVKGNPLEVFLA